MIPRRRLRHDHHRAADPGGLLGHGPDQRVGRRPGDHEPVDPAEVERHRYDGRIERTPGADAEHDHRPGPPDDRNGPIGEHGDQAGGPDLDHPSDTHRHPGRDRLAVHPRRDPAGQLDDIESTAPGRADEKMMSLEERIVDPTRAAGTADDDPGPAPDDPPGVGSGIDAEGELGMHGRPAGRRPASGEAEPGLTGANQRVVMVL